MKIVVLGWEYPPQVAGGLGAACEGLTRALARAGHEVILAVPEQEASEGAAPLPMADHPNIERIEIPVSGDGQKPVPVFSPYVVPDAAPVESTANVKPKAPAPPRSRSAINRRLYGGALDTALRRYTRGVLEALGDRRFDVVHAHDWMTIPAATRLRLATGSPICLHVHSTSFDRAGKPSGAWDPIRRLESIGARTADRIIAVSEYCRDVVVREYGVDPARVDVVHNGVPEGDEGPVTDAPDPGRPVVLFLGRLTRQKGAAFLLRTVALVREQVPGARFLIAGDGDSRKELIEMSAELGVAGSVFFTSGLSDEARDRAYREATVFVLPSVSEPFGLTPLEALQQGTPSVLSSASGVREILRSAPAPDPWDRQALADSIVELLTDPDARERLVADGRDEVSAYTWRRSGETLARSLADASTDARPPRWLATNRA